MKKKDILYGRNTIIEALKSDITLEQILISKKVSNHDIKEIYQLADAKAIPIRKVPIERIEYLLYPFYKNDRINHQGVISIVSDFVYQNIDDIYHKCMDIGRVPTFLYLDHITDVRNFGSIARSAFCFEVDAIMIPRYHSVSVTADAQKTSAGALAHIPVCRLDHVHEQLQYFRDCGFQIVGATEKSQQNYLDIEWTLPTIVVMGSEGEGISQQTARLLTHQVSIPMNNDAFDSLNVSVSAGIILSIAYLKKQKSLR